MYDERTRKKIYAETLRKQEAKRRQIRGNKANNQSIGDINVNSKCSVCGKVNPSNANFCGSCGKKLVDNDIVDSDFNSNVYNNAFNKVKYNNGQISFFI